MSSVTEIANLALSHLGTGKEITALTTENSAEARAVRRFYETTRDAILRDFPWPFATKTFTLGLVESTPTTEWDYSYTYPSDCIYFRRILSGIRNDTRASRIPYRIIHADASSLIYTDEQNAVSEYTMRVTDSARFSADFVMALSWRLASYMAARVTAGDRFRLGEKAMKFYLFELGKAQANASGEEQPEIAIESEFITGRE